MGVHRAIYALFFRSAVPRIIGTTINQCIAMCITCVVVVAFGHSCGTAVVASAAIASRSRASRSVESICNNLPSGVSLKLALLTVMSLNVNLTPLIAGGAHCASCCFAVPQLISATINHCSAIVYRSHCRLSLIPFERSCGRDVRCHGGSFARSVVCCWYFHNCPIGNSWLLRV